MCSLMSKWKKKVDGGWHMERQHDCSKQSDLTFYAAFIWTQLVAISASLVTPFIWYLWIVVSAFLAKSIKITENTPITFGYNCLILQKWSLNETKPGWDENEIKPGFASLRYVISLMLSEMHLTPFFRNSSPLSRKMIVTNEKNPFGKHVCLNWCIKTKATMLFCHTSYVLKQTMRSLHHG